MMIATIGVNHDITNRITNREKIISKALLPNLFATSSSGISLKESTGVRP